MIKNLITLGAVFSALTFGSQTVFASEIAQSQTSLNQGQSKLQADIQSESPFFWFHLSRLDRIASSGTFTINSNTKVKVIAFTGSVSYPVFPDSKVYIVNPNGKTLSMSVVGNQYKEEYFELEPGTYYLECVNYGSGPIYMNVNLYKN
ncbi:hypothetical protein ABE237_17110 [Brevibacillus formosus]|uniref:hypothetical protein n=1 Tax=Brevibacillus TaxID=55080 RepID=UPI000D10AE77|nr:MULTISPECIES: hypothetical protein [Brevibacillus]MBG9944403.1 hypothetical protein [Brevibacillus formosus]MED1946291.1 hypothetical protein [Brevibacillus formosus]MED1998787.1 hypothetical protein [Brevibacillus formosus]MED2084156.1 hypothetical protein [Brevibacillus formosus]PSK18188.1 hypothetical protein C7R94_13565 [Brevibacillus sp. NRRL NRS-603]